MKRIGHYLQHLFISLTLVVTSLSIPINVSAQDALLDKQIAECKKNSAAEWSSATNKCVGKVEDRKSRHDALDCNKIPDLKQRAECHKKLAEEKTGLSSDPNSLNQGGTDKSMMMNGGISLAYTIVGLINSFGSGGKSSKCMSKSIFGVTAFAGFASDIFLKIRAKKKVNELQDKYKLEVQQGAFDAQVKALQYLKEEQQTVADIASMEKKRNMLLMLGYGAASIMAIYEMTPYGQNPDCYKPDNKETKDPKPETKVEPKPDAPAPTAPAAPAPEAPAAVAPAPEAPAEAVAPEAAKPVAVTANADTAPVAAEPAKAAPTATVDHTTKNGKQFYDIKNDPTTGTRSAIIDNKVVDYKTGNVLGKYDYKTGVISYTDGTTANTFYKAPNSAPVSVSAPDFRSKKIR